MTLGNLPYLKQAFPARLAIPTVYCHAFYILNVFSLTRAARADCIGGPFIYGVDAFAYITVVVRVFFSFLHVSIFFF